MQLGFLFWLFFVGLIIASLQDLKRREIDNWLNLFLLSTSFVYIFYKGLLEGNIEIIFLGIFSLIILFCFMNLLYYGKVFGGGDAKLLFAMSAFFVSGSFGMTITNIFLFLSLLMLSGFIYIMTYIFILYLINPQLINLKKSEIPFAPVFLISFLIYVFFRIKFISLLL